MLRGHLFKRRDFGARSRTATASDRQAAQASEREGAGRGDGERRGDCIDAEEVGAAQGVGDPVGVRDAAEVDVGPAKGAEGLERGEPADPGAAGDDVAVAVAVDASLVCGGLERDRVGCHELAQRVVDGNVVADCVAHTREGRAIDGPGRGVEDRADEAEGRAGDRRAGAGGGLGVDDVLPVRHAPRLRGNRAVVRLVTARRGEDHAVLRASREIGQHDRCLSRTIERENSHQRKERTTLHSKLSLFLTFRPEDAGYPAPVSVRAIQRNIHESVVDTLSKPLNAPFRGLCRNFRARLHVPWQSQHVGEE